MQAAGRTRVVQAYVWLTGIVTLFLFVQGGLIGAWLYKPSEDWTLDAHGIVGSVIGFVAIVPFLLALRARFPRRLKLGWWTFAWAFLMEHSGPHPGLRHQG